MSEKMAVLAPAVLALTVAVFDPAGQPTAPGIENDVRFNKIRLETGIQLHYAEQGPADGEAVIMLHGLSDSWWSFSRILPLLPNNVRAFALDLRGHGESDKPATNYTTRDMARDVVAFMKAKGIARATIVGHSMGSFVAPFVAVEAPERVARLVLIGSGTALRTFNGMSDLKAATDALTDPVSLQFIREFQESTITLPVPREFMERVIIESQKLSASNWRALMAGLLASDAPRGLAELRIPTLLLWGELDPYAPRTQQDALIKQQGTAQLRIYAGRNHAPHWERPDEVAADIAAFLQIEPAQIAR